MVFRPETVTSRVIRDEALYAGVRVTMDCAIARATVKLRLDVNFGDPITPDPKRFHLPVLRPGQPPIPLLGYPLETVLAEKICTAIALGPANTRVRDYADIYTLTGQHDVTHTAVRAALAATADFRSTPVIALSSAIGDFVDLRQAAYAAYRAALGPDGTDLPAGLGEVVRAVLAFSDPLAASASASTRWDSLHRRWTA